MKMPWNRSPAGSGAGAAARVRGRRRQPNRDLRAWRAGGRLTAEPTSGPGAGWIRPRSDSNHRSGEIVGPWTTTRAPSGRPLPSFAASSAAAWPRCSQRRRSPSARSGSGSARRDNRGRPLARARRSGRGGAGVGHRRHRPDRPTGRPHHAGECRRASANARLRAQSCFGNRSRSRRPCGPGRLASTIAPATSRNPRPPRMGIGLDLAVTGR